MIDGASKATWLRRVESSSLRRYVPAFIVLTVSEWQLDARHCLQRIKTRFRSDLVAMRSSRASECAGLHSQAGRYLSLGPLSGSDAAALSDAIQRVIARYNHVKPSDELLIQRWVTDARAVIGASSATATHHPGSASVSYREGSETNAITAGWCNTSRFWLSSGSPPRREWPSAVQRAFGLLSQLERLLQSNALELEIAVAQNGRLRLLQVTPSTRASARVSEVVRNRILRAVESAYGECQAPRTGELGQTTVLGLMPDWNPAELIGEHPRALALSLFDSLITRRSWRVARIELGYRTSPVHPLLMPLAGRPYVDVRASLSSLIPSQLTDNSATAVVEASIERLRRAPSLHDRIETELQPTCVGFADESRQQLHAAGLKVGQQRQWESALQALEARWLKGPSQQQSIEMLRSALNDVRRNIYAASNDLPALMLCLEPIRILALDFARHARLAFVARFQLESLCRAGAIKASRVNELSTDLSSLSGISQTVGSYPLSRRPSTFDIRVPPIASPIQPAQRATPRFELSTAERRMIGASIASRGFSEPAEAWLQRSRQRIELRECSKSILACAVSDWLAALSSWGAGQELGTESLSHLSIDALREAQSIGRLRDHSARAAVKHASECIIRMPSLITQREDFRASVDTAARPTFFGRGRVSARVLVIDRFDVPHRLDEGLIVAIRAADPGFDWILEHSIAALITCFGGPHSHMAIRCEELGLPYVLGCGETTYDAVSGAQSVAIDFDQRHLSVTA